MDTVGRRQRLSSGLLGPLAQQILEHTKQLGLFDEMRIRVLESIESSREFGKLKSEFKLEMEDFCAHADLSLPRAKLRERLTCRLLHQTTEKLRELVRLEISSKRQRQEIKQLYNKRAMDYLEANVLDREESPSPDKAPVSPSAEAEAQQDELAAQTVALSTGSSHSSTADSGISSASSIGDSIPLAASTPPPAAPLLDDQEPAGSSSPRLAKGPLEAQLEERKKSHYYIPKIKREPAASKSSTTDQPEAPTTTRQEKLSTSVSEPVRERNTNNNCDFSDKNASWTTTSSRKRNWKSRWDQPRAGHASCQDSRHNSGAAATGSDSSRAKDTSSVSATGGRRTRDRGHPSTSHSESSTRTKSRKSPQHTNKTKHI